MRTIFPMLFAGCILASGCAAKIAEPGVKITSPAKPQKSGDLTVNFTYTPSDDEQLQTVQFYAKRLSPNPQTLYLGSSELTKLGQKISSSKKSENYSAGIPVSKLPEGNYQLVMRKMFRKEMNKSFLTARAGAGRSIIGYKAFKGTDFEVQFRISRTLGFSVRTQNPKMNVDSNSWRYYESNISDKGGNATSAVVDNKWRRIGEVFPSGTFPLKNMYSVKIRCVGNSLTYEIDGKKMTRVDSSNYYPSGTVSFRSPDSGRECFVTDFKITDLKTGKVYAEDFSAGKLSSDWIVGNGFWDISRGYVETEDVVITNFKASKPVCKELVKTELLRCGDGYALMVNGKEYVPLFFSCVVSRDGNVSYTPDMYDPIRRVYESGVRLFAPTVSGLNFFMMDDIMAQLQIACPDAYFMLRTSIPVPNDLPKGDHIKFRDGTGDANQQEGLDGSKSSNSLSLASEEYVKKHIPVLVPRLIEHFKEAGFADRVMGFLINGAGYEGGWGTGGMWPYYLVDVCDAMMKKYSDFLRAKYGTEENLRKAWGDPAATFAKPYVPSFRERTVSDLAGFRSPVGVKRAKINDYLDFYSSTNRYMAPEVYMTARRCAPYSFITAWAGGSGLNTSYGNIQAKGGTDASTNTYLSCYVSLETYGDRKAGGVSINANYADESVHMRSKMHLQELDLHPPTDKQWGDTWAGLAASFRREFAVNVLMRKDALWYFDMGFTGPWYDNPAPLKEMEEEQRVGKIFLDMPRRSCSEIVLVQDGRYQRYYAMSPEQYTAKGKIPWNVPIHYNENYATHAPEGAVRSGAPCAGLNMRDMPIVKDRGKMYIFPGAGYMEKNEVSFVRDLAGQGAVCVFMGPAAMLNKDSISLDNIMTLTGMKIKLASIGDQSIFSVKSSDPLLQGIKPGTRLGAGRWFDNAQRASWHRFVIEETPDLIPVARYKDGQLAMAAKKTGKGWIIYSGTAITHPAIYRSIAKLAGVHIYNEANDYTFADCNFVLVHSKEAGKKTIKFRHAVKDVRDTFTGKNIGKNCTQVTLDMAAGSSVVLYIGDDPKYLNRLNQR